MTLVQLDGQIALELAQYLGEPGATTEVERMLASCPRLRRHVESDRAALMERQAFDSALRNGAPWTHADYERARADMEAGEPAWRTAMALSRTPEAVRAARQRLRKMALAKRRLRHG